MPTRKESGKSSNSPTKLPDALSSKAVEAQEGIELMERESEELNELSYENTAFIGINVRVRVHP